MALRDSFKPHVVLVSPILPDMNGRLLVRLLRQPRNCGVVVLSGMSDDMDQVTGGGYGADDFIAKPATMREIAARIRAVHQRVNLRGGQGRASLCGCLGHEG